MQSGGLTKLNRRRLLIGAAAGLLAAPAHVKALGLRKRELLFGTPRPTGGISFSGGYPLDSVTGVTITGAYGIGALRASWKTGALFDLDVGGVTTTIYGVGPGYPDVRAIAAACGVSPTSGIGGGTISKFYDQSGAGNDFVQASTSGGVRPQLWLINGKVWIDFPSQLNIATGLGLSRMTNAAAVNNQSLSISAAINPFTTVGNISLSGFFGTGTFGSPAADDIGITSSVVAVSPVYAGIGDFTNGVQRIISPYIGIQPQIVGATANASGITYFQNNSSGTGSALVAGTHSANILGALSGNNYAWGGRLQAFILSSSVFSAGQVSTMRTTLASWANVSLTTTTANGLNVVVDGASSDIGQGSDPTGGYSVTGGGGYGYVEQLKDQLGPGVSWHNFAQSGAPITSLTPNYNNGMVQSTFQASSTSNILLAPGVSSIAELLNDAGNATTAFNNFQTWLTAAKSVAWTRIAVIAYPDSATTGMAAYNTSLFANAASLGYDIIDGRTALLPLVTPNNPPYTTADGHPTVQGSAIYVGLIKPYLQQFL